MDTTIGERIKRVRKDKGYTQQKMADVLGLKQNTIATYEMNKTIPSDRTILDICEKFHIREEWLRTGKEPMEAPVDEDQELADFFAQIYQAEPDDPCRRVIAVMQKINKNHPELFQAVFDAVAETHKKQED